jgi:hypothetical protein
MPDLTVTRALPNPAGKDRTPNNQVTNQQLNGEWMEFANTTPYSIALQDFQLLHYTFDRGCQKTGEDLVMSFTGNLAAGHSVRVHSGSGTPYTESTIRHLFVNGGNFIWNNRCGDTAVLRNAARTLVDWANYEANPPEGVVLNRVPGTNRLRAVPATRTA